VQYPSTRFRWNPFSNFGNATQRIDRNSLITRSLRPLSSKTHENQSLQPVHEGISCVYCDSDTATEFGFLSCPYPYSYFILPISLYIYGSRTSPLFFIVFILSAMKLTALA